MNKKRKILFLLHLPPPVHGSSMVGEFIRKSPLINSTFECQYINLLASKLVSDSGKVTFDKFWNFFKIWTNLFFSLINEKPTLCYYALTISGIAFYRDIFFIFLLKLFRIKLIYHLHNKGVSMHESNMLYRLSYSFIFKNCKVILLSEYLYDDIKSFVPKNMVSICPNGIPIISEKNEKNGANKKVKILYLSNLIDSKGVFNLLEALLLLNQKEIEYECFLVGGEGNISSDELIKQIKSLGLGNNVFYLGKKFGKEKDLILSEADLFVLPTYYPMECLPLVILEAMSFSLPVISTYEGGIPDMIEQDITGYLIDYYDINSFAEKMKYLIQNPEDRLKMGEMANKKFKMEFTLNIFQTNLCKILQSNLS